MRTAGGLNDDLRDGERVGVGFAGPCFELETFSRRDALNRDAAEGKRLAIRADFRRPGSFQEIYRAFSNHSRSAVGFYQQAGVFFHGGSACESEWRYQILQDCWRTIASPCLQPNAFANASMFESGPLPRKRASGCGSVLVCKRAASAR